MFSTRRRILQAAGSAASLALPAWVQAQNAVTRLVVPFPPGGATDITARSLSEPLGRALGHPVIVDNLAGAGGSIGMAALARAAPDGRTLGIATLSTHGVNPVVYKKLPYDAANDFAPVSEIVRAPGVLVVHPSVQARTLADFVALLKAQPGKMQYASPGTGTIGHMWGELFKSGTGTFMLHIPYRGAGPALNDLLGGQVQAYFDQVASSLPHIQAGKVRALAVSWPERLKVLPDVPTYAEAGLASANSPSWFGLLAPKGTPAPVVKTVYEAVLKSLQDGGLRDKLAAQGLFASGTAPDAFAQQIRAEIVKWQRVANLARIVLE